jgi:hypothetical protein
MLLQNNRGGGPLKAIKKSKRAMTPRNPLAMQTYSFLPWQFNLLGPLSSRIPQEITLTLKNIRITSMYIVQQFKS